MTASGIEKAVNGLYAMTLMSVTAVEEIIIFVINMMYSTYLCLITAVVNGTAIAALDVFNDAQDNIKGAVDKVGDSVGNAGKEVQDAINSFAEKVNTAASLFGSSVQIPTVDLKTQIDAIKAIEVPNDLAQDFQKLTDQIPDFKTIQDKANDVLRIPFEMLKDQINSSLGVYSFDRGLFPVPQKETISFCSGDDGINGFFDGLVKTMSNMKTVFIGVIIAAAVLACVPMAWREIRRWRMMQDRARLVGTRDHDPMDVVYIVSRPHTSGWGISLSSKIKAVRRQSLVRWAVAYATTEAALFVLALGVAGLFTCLLHYIILQQIQQQVPALSNQVGDFADKIVFQLDNASASWASGANQVITQKQASLNEEMFGWVNVSTNAINDTLNSFVEETTELLDKAFGNTLLKEPVNKLFECLIGLKVESFQKGLTWVEEHAKVSFPLLANDTFSLGAAASIAGDQSADQSFLASPGDAASDKITSAVVRVTNKLIDDLTTEAIISTCVVGIWFFLVFVGIVRAIILWPGREKSRGEGGAPNLDAISPSYGGHESISAPIDFRSDNQDRFQNVPLHNEPAPNYSKDDPFGTKKTMGIAQNPYQQPGRDLTTRTSYYTDNKI